MKKLLLFISASLLFSGCSYNVVISDYKTEAEYYNTVNDLTEDKAARIETKDSSLALENIRVSEDSVTGKFLQPTSAHFSHFYYSPPDETPVSLSTKDVKSISITKRGYSIFKGMGLGALAGGYLGYVFFDFGGSSNSGYHPQPEVDVIMGFLAGTVLGGLTGLIVGDDYVFSFDNDLTRNEFFKDNSVHKLGLKVGYHSGYNMYIVPGEGRSKSDISDNGNSCLAVTIFYNYVLGKNFSLNNELSFISSGTDEKYSLHITRPDNSTVQFSGKFSENIKVLEAAPLLRINLGKAGFTPYLIIGPKFGLQFPPGNSSKEKFYSYINNQYGSADFSISGNYKNSFWSMVLGAGISTGKLGPYEILLEVRYSKDVTSRFKVDYYNTNSLWSYYYNQPHHNWEHAAEEIIFNIGVAIF